MADLGTLTKGESTRREFLRRGATAGATAAVGIALSKPARSIVRYIGELFQTSKAYAQHKNGLNASPDTAKDYNRVNMDGLKLYSNGDYRGAIRKFEEAISINKSINAAYINMENAY